MKLMTMLSIYTLHNVSQFKSFVNSQRKLNRNFASYVYNSAFYEDFVVLFSTKNLLCVSRQGLSASSS